MYPALEQTWRFAKPSGPKTVVATGIDFFLGARSNFI